MDQNLKTDAVTLTKALCGHLAAAQFGDLSVAAKREARRGVLDWIGCALAGSGHRTITTLLGVLQETSSKPAATVFGRKLKLGLLDAPLANGQMGHVLDFDDTHMGGVVLHTSSPVLAALFALADPDFVPARFADFCEQSNDFAVSRQAHPDFFFQHPSGGLAGADLASVNFQSLDDARAVRSERIGKFARNRFPNLRELDPALIFQAAKDRFFDSFCEWHDVKT